MIPTPDTQISMGKTQPVKLRYTLPALADLADILDYIAARSPTGAANIQARIKAITVAFNSASFSSASSPHHSSIHERHASLPTRYVSPFLLPDTL